MAQEALARGGIQRADLVLAFCSNRNDPVGFFSDVRNTVGNDVPVIGGSAIGVISNDFLNYRDTAAGIMAIESNSVRFRSTAVNSINLDARGAGEKLGRAIGSDAEDKGFLLFYDSIKNSPDPDAGPVMNSSSFLLKGLYEVFDRRVPILGAGLIGDYEFLPAVEFCGSNAATQHAVGLMIGGQCSLHYRIMHGCSPLDGIYHTITSVDGPILREVDGRPVIDMIDELFGSDQWQKEVPVNFLTIGVNRGPKYEYKETYYVNRLITGIAPDKKGVIMFEEDLDKGMEIQFMARDADQMIESARNNSNDLIEKIVSDGRKPVLGMYIDCAGRVADYSNTVMEEASGVQAALSRHNVPLLGFYSGVEIAPLMDESRGLDWTGVLIIITED